MDDFALLRQFADGDHDCFASIVDRHIGLVYSAALRQTCNATFAQDVTQAVFILLARKAGKISEQTILAGWLFRTTRFVAAKAMRSEARRRQREQEAAQMQIAESPNLNWHELASVLDESMAELTNADRDALLLRYFENQSLEQVGHAFGISEDAAQKRVARALEKLRHRFARKNVVLPTIILGSALAANSVHAAPMALKASISAVVANHSIIGASVYQLVKSSLQHFFWTKVGVTGTVSALVLAGGVMLYHSLTPAPTSTPAVSPQTTYSVQPAGRSNMPVTSHASLNPPNTLATNPSNTVAFVSQVTTAPQIRLPVTNQPGPNIAMPVAAAPTNKPVAIVPHGDSANANAPDQHFIPPIDPGLDRNSRNFNSPPPSSRNTGIKINRRQP